MKKNPDFLWIYQETYYYLDRKLLIFELEQYTIISKFEI